MRKKYIIDRFISLCYDYIFVIILFLLFTFGLKFLNEKLFHLSHFMLILLIIFINIAVYLLIYTYFSYKFEGSIGKYLNDLYIEPTYGKITYGRILFRELLMKQLLYLTVIGFLYEIIFFLRKKQTLHDYYLKTSVLKKGHKNIEIDSKNQYISKNK